MKLSMKSRYGLRALIDLSVNSKNEQVALGGIAERNNISPQYLEQVFASLRKAGIVKSIKGSQGGYFLNKPAEQITISEVIEPWKVIIESRLKMCRKTVTIKQHRRQYKNWS